jgi:E3 ubiquitin-protein ligase MYCBP2
LALPEHPILQEQFVRWSGIRNQIEALMGEVIIDEALDKEPDHVLNPASEYYRNPTSFARDRLAFYMCSRCKSPYYGGHERCGEPEALQQPDDAYLCKPCSARCFCKQTCAKHGETGMIFKCFWCCRPAVWFCWGTTHFCEPCHNIWQRAQKGPWPECDGKCQFHPHAPNGTKERFGYCTICEAEKAQELGLRPHHHC